MEDQRDIVAGINTGLAGLDAVGGVVPLVESGMTMIGDATVKVEAQWGCDDEQLVDFLSELRQSVSDVRIERYPSGPGGPGEIYFLVSLVGIAGGFYLKAFLEALGAEHAKALNRKLLDVLHSSEARQHFRRMYPLRIGANKTWFHIAKPCFAEELTARFRLAAEVVEHIEAGKLAGAGASPLQDEDQHCFCWDEESDLWKPMPVNEYGPELPADAG